MANNLRTEKKLAVLSALTEGCSVRSTERMTGVHRDTICRLLVRVGEGCANLLDSKMVDLGCERLEIDELWSFVGKKQRSVTERDDERRVGDQWTYVAIDAETKLIPSFLVGKREARNTNALLLMLPLASATACSSRRTDSRSISRPCTAPSAETSTTRRS